MAAHSSGRAIEDAIYALIADPGSGDLTFGRIASALPQYSRAEIGAALRSMGRERLIYRTQPSGFYGLGSEGLRRERQGRGQDYGP